MDDIYIGDGHIMQIDGWKDQWTISTTRDHWKKIRINDNEIVLEGIDPNSIDVIRDYSDYYNNGEPSFVSSKPLCHVDDDKFAIMFTCFAIIVYKNRYGNDFIELRIDHPDVTVRFD